MCLVHCKQILEYNYGNYELLNIVNNISITFDCTETNLQLLFTIYQFTICTTQSRHATVACYLQKLFRAIICISA